MAGGSGAKQNIEGLQHEGNVGVQSAFLKDVQSLTVVIQDMDNHFFEECNDLFVLDVGQDQCSKFVDELLSKCMTTVTDPLPKNKRPLFRYPAVKETSKGSLQLLSMKNECNLFSPLYLACQARYGYVNKFVCHGNHPYPLSLISVTGRETTAWITCRYIALC